MPRIRLKAKDYARSDFEAWVRAEMKKQKATCEQMGALIGVSASQYSRKLASMAFNYGELVTIMERLNCPPEKLVYFMTGQIIKEVS